MRQARIRAAALALASLGALLAAAACKAPPERSPQTAPQAATGCAARASAPWSIAGQTYSIDAFADGPNCAQAVATLVVRDPKGVPAWVDSRIREQVMTLAEASDPASMRKALAEWVDPHGSTLQTTGDLPEWTAKRSEPYLGEFPFYPEQGVSRLDYEALRALKLPIFCYVQGMESMACVALRDGVFEKVGVQTFPG